IVLLTILYMLENRVKFLSSEQKIFILDVKEKNKLNTFQLSKRLGVSVGAVKHYLSESQLLPVSLTKKLCDLSKRSFEDLNVSIIPSNWGQIKGGKKAMGILETKYKYKITNWRAEGRKSGCAGKNLKKISLPKMDESLAEFIGIYLGDGTINTYTLKISGDARYDLKYFEYISNLGKKLFNLDSKIVVEKNRPNVLLLIIRSKNLCFFLKNKYSLHFGNKIKNNTKIPEVILKSRKLSLACLRGLVDTDGCISRRGRNGSQFCVQFFNSNKVLLEQVKELGYKYGVFSYFTGGETGTNKWGNVEKYFKEVGSSNLKHIVRFLVRINEGKTLYLREVLQYYPLKKYKELIFPFKLNSPARN
ncbi:MAG: LAGLIDADG family homing endonuclease, partial [archaeon]